MTAPCLSTAPLLTAPHLSTAPLLTAPLSLYCPIFDWPLSFYCPLSLYCPFIDCPCIPTAPLLTAPCHCTAPLSTASSCHSTAPLLTAPYLSTAPLLTSPYPSTAPLLTSPYLYYPLIDCPLSLYCPFIDCPLSLYCPFIDCPLSLYCPFIDCPPPPVTLLPLYWLPLCNILFFATLWQLLIYHAFYFLALAVGLPLITLAGGGGGGGWLIASYVCSVIDAWKLWSIMNTSYFSYVLFFLALAVGLSLITWGGGGIDYILCFLFSFSIPCKFLFACLCNILFWLCNFLNTTYLSCFLFFRTCCWSPTDNMGGGGGGVCSV